MTRTPAPENLAELGSFLGMVNHLAKFLPNIVDMTQPLRHLLHGYIGWYWGQMQEDALSHVKADLSGHQFLHSTTLKQSLLFPRTPPHTDLVWYFFRNTLIGNVCQVRTIQKP